MQWLSATWAANWRSLQYYNLYRLVLALLFGVALLIPNQWIARIELSASFLTFGLTGVYVALATLGLLASSHWQTRFNIQLSLQVMIDVAIITVLMFLAGGVASGLGFLLLVSLAAASLVGQGRLVLLYSALATFAVLIVQFIGISIAGFEPGSIVQAGLLSAGFFATAISARLLGQRVMLNEELARRRGVEVENQILISQRIVDRMQDGVLIVGRDGALKRFNPMAQEMLKLPEDFVGGKLALAERLKEWTLGSLGVPFDFVAGDGRELRARFEKTDSTDAEMLVFLEDLGRVKERAQQLKLAALGRLTASIAHEIRNPLSAIGHAGELLREERRSEMQERLLRILNDNVLRLDRIVRDILELGRQNRADPELLQLDEFCAGLVEHFASAEGLAPEIVVLQVPRHLALCFDRSHLHQILWNLVSNALRHSSRGPGAVRIEARDGASEGRVELHVIDDGPGIPEAVREQIFEPFFTTHTQGTGLGLFIARELCATNGASLELLPSASGAHFIVAGRNDTCQLPEPNGARAAN